MAMTDPCGGKHLRADAEHNRGRILSAAREVFARDGLEAPLAEVARRAGVGIATLYRRFRNRSELITAVFDDNMDASLAILETSLADPDPWHAFATYVERMCELQAADHGFTDVLTRSFPSAEQFEAKRARAFRGFTTLVVRAKASGQLRADFTDQDLVLLLMANAGVIAAMGEVDPDAWRRPVAYQLQAFAATNTDPLPPAPQRDALFRAMARPGEERNCPG